jgi:D-alanyl-lipoteichoic acid acyltransferase DltB (MBOAT superfamily)
VLFNTLAYAQFFGLVFVAGWALVERRWAPLLPWLWLAVFAIQLRSVPALGLTAVCLGATALLCRKPEPDLRTAAGSVLLNLGALTALTVHLGPFDPVTLSLASLGVPVERLDKVQWVLFVLGAVLLALMVRARRVRLLFFLCASYYFYAHWDYRFLGLIWASSTADWLLGHAIARADTAEKKKLWLVVTVVMNLGVLGFFKYANFGIDSMVALLEGLGLRAPRIALEVALPIGISFFTFESMSYVIDVYRKELEPHKSYLEYLTFVAFFPHLVAGPIVRPRDLLPQLGGPARFSPSEASEGLFLIAAGLLKKVVIGDYLALNLVDRVFDAPTMYSSLETYTAIVGYALQIYCDFSGYTDVAIGSALLLGIRFPLNFDAPYKAHSIQDFWRRWHISLSTWLRDYLYIPLGGNRKGKVRTYVNLMLTMLLGGLWHGASWTFVVWGGIHGAALAVNKLVDDLRGKKRATKPRSRLAHVAGVLLTFHIVLVGWVFFRADSFSKAQLIFSRLTELTLYHPNLPGTVLAVLALGLVTHFLPERLYQTLRDSFVRLPAPVQGVALFLAAVAIRQMASSDAVPFVYFQF